MLPDCAGAVAVRRLGRDRPPDDSTSPTSTTRRPTRPPSTLLSTAVSTSMPYCHQSALPNDPIIHAHLSNFDPTTPPPNSRLPCPPISSQPSRRRRVDPHNPLERCEGRTLTRFSRSSTVRKSIARVLTVINHKTRANLRELYKNKKLPLDLRAKKTRAIRRRLTKVRLALFLFVETTAVLTLFLPFL